MFFFHYTNRAGHRGMVKERGMDEVEYVFKASQPQKGMNKQHAAGFYLTRLPPSTISGRLPKIGITLQKSEFVFIFDIPLAADINQTEDFWIGGYKNTEKFLARKSKGETDVPVTGLNQFFTGWIFPTSEAQRSEEPWNNSNIGRIWDERKMRRMGVAQCAVLKTR